MTAPSHPVEVHLLGHLLKVQGPVDREVLERAASAAEATFRAMEESYALNWGGPPTSLDTTTWLLMGVLNLAHRVVSLEQEADRRTQDLESTLSKLLDDVPDESPRDHGPLFQEQD